MECYHLLCRPILKALRELGILADYADEPRPEIYHPACYLRDLHPAHDILAQGRKVSGNAQYRQNDAVIQHGSITFSSLPSDHLAVFSDPGVGADQFDERVIGIDELVDVRRKHAVSELESQLAAFVEANEGSWTDDELDRARERSEAKYETDEWVHKSSPEP
ncbi:biotin/lipoate A/B protein ligase [Halogeometricum pallidum JCM 14848]|uniref:Biotin/lipoate A/B protein ligase n=1 Tax=Halogeometricum pallidum JCM 14848 TaxID=1227487 RepID=M0D3V8_HALPD|nr:biotin/lipoate A/B protein ligase [Halogeometricum pallidum JCM 14848]